MKMNKIVLCFIMSICLQLAIADNSTINTINELLKKQDVPLNHSSDNTIQMLKQQYSIIFIFESTCPHCHRLAPIIKDFTSHYQIPLKSYSIDGGVINGIDSAPLSAKQFNDYFVQPGYRFVVPAVFLLNNKTHHAYAMFFGEASTYQLAKRANSLVKYIMRQQA